MGIKFRLRLKVEKNFHQLKVMLQNKRILNDQSVYRKNIEDPTVKKFIIQYNAVRIGHHWFFPIGNKTRPLNLKNFLQPFNTRIL